MDKVSILRLVSCKQGKSTIWSSRLIILVEIRTRRRGKNVNYIRGNRNIPLVESNDNGAHRTSKAGAHQDGVGGRLSKDQINSLNHSKSHFRGETVGKDQKTTYRVLGLIQIISELLSLLKPFARQR